MPDVLLMSRSRSFGCMWREQREALEPKAETNSFNVGGMSATKVAMMTTTM